MTSSHNSDEFTVTIPRPGSTTAGNETIHARMITTEEIPAWSRERRESLRSELSRLVLKSFPRMDAEGRNELTDGYFDRPGNGFQRFVFLLENEKGKLAATTLFDQGRFDYQGGIYTGIYSILRMVAPAYEGLGLAQHMACREFGRFQPDVLMSTSYQSAALHSWIGLYEKGRIPGYEVFPRLETGNGKDILVTLPFRDLDFAVHAFLATYSGFAKKQETRDRAVRNLTVYLARKNAHGAAYGFDPWSPRGRKDRLAELLGLGEQDAMLVIFRKTAYAARIDQPAFSRRSRA